MYGEELQEQHTYIQTLQQQLGVAQHAHAQAAFEDISADGGDVSSPQEQAVQVAAEA
jgi:hypothetical protein